MSDIIGPLTMLVLFGGAIWFVTSIAREASAIRRVRLRAMLDAITDDNINRDDAEEVPIGE